MVQNLFSNVCFSYSRRRSVLVIRHARYEDSATYECRAQGAIGPTATEFVNVSIMAPSTAAPDTSEY